MSDKKTRETTTSEEKTATMTTEEAILEIRSMQLKHDQDIKEMQLKHDQEVKEIQASLAANYEDTKRNIQMTMKMMEESTATWGTIRKEMQEMSRTFTEAKNTFQQFDNNQNDGIFSLPPKQTGEDRNTLSPITTNESTCVQNNLMGTNYHRTPTMYMPPESTAPIFHGYLSEQPAKFLYSIKDYFDATYMWGEDALLQRISIYLKGDAQEWITYLRKNNKFPKSWAEFTQQFMTHFNSPMRRTQQKQKWKECRQKENETIMQFSLRVRALWEEVYPKETEEDLVEHLLSKMHVKVMNAIVGHGRYTTVEQIISHAQIVEEAHYRREQNEKYDNNPNRRATDNNKDNANKNKPWYNKHSNTSHEDTLNNQAGQSKYACYHCGRSNHWARDCWFKNENTNERSQESTSNTKNE